ncbi:MAG: precorrin-6Y C5,15-methyltransferase (decarboxylating) subunit CbiT, partial [Pseudomonadota bacterium]
ALALGQGRASADAAHYRQDGPVLDDDLLDHDGVMTKADIRAITMAHLAPFPGGMLWDLGAGCGSISVEWARAGGQAIAVELEARRTAMIANNLARFGLGGVEILCESIADFLNRDRAAPDAVFAGGGFASHPDLLMRIWHCLRPGGVLVANSVTLEGGMRLQAMQQARPGLLTRIAVERCSRVGSLHALRPAMPILQYCGRKTG